MKDAIEAGVAFLEGDGAAGLSDCNVDTAGAGGEIIVAQKDEKRADGRGGVGGRVRAGILEVEIEEAATIGQPERLVFKEISC